MEVKIQVYSISVTSTGEAHKFNKKSLTLWHFQYNILQKGISRY